MYRLTASQGFFFLLFVVTMAQGPPFLRRYLTVSPSSRSCTPSCNRLHEMKDTPDVVCSCTASCLTYGDCCRDAPFKNNDENRKKLGCLTLSGLGPVSVVNSCPTSQGILSEACVKGLGISSSPVTSKDTGTTYSNYYCALCNRDSFDIIDWPVELQCCNKDKKTTDETVGEYVEYDNERDIMWAVSELKNGSRVFCECKFYARNDDINFTKSLELRECKRDVISSCLPSWSDDSTRQLCSAHMDPIYSSKKVYRNIHCATCNYENEHRLKCSDDPFNSKIMSLPRALSFCKVRRIRKCTDFLRTKGHLASFSDFFPEREVRCVPPKGRRCCSGERFDRFRGKCRKLPTHITQ